MIDDTDLKILTILQQNARTSNAEIARQVEMAPSAVLERIRRLESRGVIQGYETRINPEAMGLGLVAFIFVASSDMSEEMKTAEQLGHIPEVQEVHHIAGEDCFVLKVRVPNAKSLGRLLRERIGAIPTVRSTRTTVVLETVRESSLFPLRAPEPAAVTEVPEVVDLALEVFRE
ncbi:MAG TPA: Lrp/AsnC family transcriptional regulator [Thermoanaerobaculia bacterium]|nr:Lrp/AsnC family transcriptional regulator [Thermoanaerobaculia bacterium]